MEPNIHLSFLKNARYMHDVLLPPHDPDPKKVL